MCDVHDYLSQLVSAKAASPFLFVGSGFSRRYLGVEDWNGLLKRFCDGEKPYEYYRSKAERDEPTIASLMAADIYESWWTNPNFEEVRERNKAKVVSTSSPFKILISEYLKDAVRSEGVFAEYAEEIDLLKDIPVDGVITTNWDMFIEQLLPGFKVYVGQESLLSSSPQGVGEIYKIHGCISQPQSLILTKEDYAKYHEKNAYLAAKLITIFVEHPIFFIGYKIQDKNIVQLFSDIVKCLDEKHLRKLGDNLVFVQRTHQGEHDDISKTILPLGGLNLPITLVKASNFSPVYQAIVDHKRKMPARILRYFKEQLYELVQSGDPQGKIQVINLDQLDDHKDLDFVVGVGVAGQDFTEIGYSSIKLNDLFEHYLFENKGFIPDKLLQNTLPELKRAKYLPVYKYLRATGVNSAEEYQQSKLGLDKYIKLKSRDYILKRTISGYKSHGVGKPFSDLVKTQPVINILHWLPLMKVTDLDIDEVLTFLKANFESIKDDRIDMSVFRKAVCYIDKIKYRWD